jgi:glycosyltransferase involved in cell wall biosynthesis
MAKPFFSIIMANYKTEMFLEEALCSVKNQTYKNFECILINDGSPGLSKKEILAQKKNTIYKNQVDISGYKGQIQWREVFNFVSKMDSRFIAVNKKNGGQGSARNRGLGLASGEFIVFLDCDDVLTPSHLQNIFDKLRVEKKHWSDTVFLFDDVKEFYLENGEKIFRSFPMIQQKAKNPTFHTCLVFNENGLTCSAVHKDLLGKTRFSWLTKSMEDVEILYRLGAQQENKKSRLVFRRISIDTVERRLHDSSITYNDSRDGFKKEKRDKILSYKNLLQNHDLAFRDKILCRLGILRFSLVNKYGIFGKLLKKPLTLLAKIISGWYV